MSDHPNSAQSLPRSYLVVLGGPLWLHLGKCGTCLHLYIASKLCTLSCGACYSFKIILAKWWALQRSRLASYSETFLYSHIALYFVSITGVKGQKSKNTQSLSGMIVSTGNYWDGLRLRTEVGCYTTCCTHASYWASLKPYGLFLCLIFVWFLELFEIEYTTAWPKYHH